MNNSSYRYEKLHTKSLIRTLSTKTKLQYRTCKVSNVLKRDSLILLRLKFVSQPLILPDKLKAIGSFQSNGNFSVLHSNPPLKPFIVKNVLSLKTSPGSRPKIRLVPLALMLPFHEGQRREHTFLCACPHRNTRRCLPKTSDFRL